MPTLETQRLIVRPFALDDLDDAHRILDLDAKMDEQPRDERRHWLQWSVMNYVELAKLAQPPYGDRAVVLKSTGRLIGVCGLVPLLMPFGKLPYYRALAPDARDDLTFPEVGLFWTIDSAFRHQGYATEAARALVEFAFGQLNLRRILATTEYTNLASIGVMLRLGMRIDKNATPGSPPYLQVAGILENSLV
jgi:RimJ/RimL family protein N-acetyltransferase